MFKRCACYFCQDSEKQNFYFHNLSFYTIFSPSKPPCPPERGFHLCPFLPPCPPKGGFHLCPSPMSVRAQNYSPFRGMSRSDRGLPGGAATGGFPPQRQGAFRSAQRQGASRHSDRASMRLKPAIPYTPVDF